MILEKLLETGEEVVSIAVLHPGEEKSASLKWQSLGQEVRITVPVHRGCALVKLECAHASAHGYQHS